MIDLAIIIVSWNVQDLLAACLTSLQADLDNSRLNGRIWVVDNASTDESPAMVRRNFPAVQLIAGDKNLVFAGGNNAALRAMGFDDQPGRYAPRPGSDPPQRPQAVLLLNPDTVVQPGALQTMVDFLLDNPQVGIVGPRLKFGDETFQHAAFAFPGLWQLAIELLPLPGRLAESSLNGRYPRALYEAGRPFQVGHPLGAAMCVRGSAIEQVGLLDESYHMYVEEVDWSRRIVLTGWQAYCVPQAVITHYGGQSTGQIRSSSFVNLWRSRYYFYHKYYGAVKLRCAREIVRLGMHQRKRNDAEARQQGKLSQAEYVERLDSYREVTRIWQGSEA